MAVPGSPIDPRAQGCNQLIRDGATLIQTAADVMESITHLNGRVASPLRPFDHQPTPAADPEPDIRIRVEELLGPSPAPVDEIVRLSGADPGAVQLVLLELDLAGRLDRHAGNKVSLNGA
jgi:DNA processing protein